MNITMPKHCPIHGKTGEPKVSREEGMRRILKSWLSAPPFTKMPGTAPFADLVWPKNTFRNSQGAARAVQPFVKELERLGIVHTVSYLDTWARGLDRSKAQEWMAYNDPSQRQGTPCATT